MTDEERVEARRAFGHAYHMANRDKHLAYRRAHYEANRLKYLALAAHRYPFIKDAKRAYDIVYRAENSDERRAQRVAYATAHREEINAKNKAYRAQNHDKVRGWNNGRRARQKGAVGSHTVAEWEAKKKEHGRRCLDCGAKEGHQAANGSRMKLTRGHAVPLCKGGSNAIVNIIPQCLRCNLKQGRNIHPSVVAFSLFDRSIAS